MGMQCHFQIADLTDLLPAIKVHRHQDHEEDEKGNRTGHVDYYIVVDPESFYFSCEADYTQAWFDIGQTSLGAMRKLQWLIHNRVCFSAS